MFPTMAKKLNVRKHVTPTKYLAGIIKLLSTIWISKEIKLKLGHNFNPRSNQPCKYALPECTVGKIVSVTKKTRNTLMH